MNTNDPTHTASELGITFTRTLEGVRTLTIPERFKSLSDYTFWLYDENKRLRDAAKEYMENCPADPDTTASFLAAHYKLQAAVEEKP